MAKFIFEMPDDMTALVEAYRVRRGHKATAVAVRELISAGLEAADGQADPLQTEAVELSRSAEVAGLDGAKSAGLRVWRRGDGWVGQRFGSTEIFPVIDKALT